MAAPKTAPVERKYIVTNDIKGRTLHLGDGRRLKHNESAEVSKELYDLIEARGG